MSAKVSFLRVVAKSISEEHSLCKIIEGASFLRCLSFELSTLNSIWHFFISIVKLIYCLCMSSWWTFIFTLSYPVWAGEQGLCFHQTRSSFIYLLTCVCCTAQAQTDISWKASWQTFRNWPLFPPYCFPSFTQVCTLRSYTAGSLPGFAEGICQLCLRNTVRLYLPILLCLCAHWIPQRTQWISLSVAETVWIIST